MSSAASSAVGSVLDARPPVGARGFATSRGRIDLGSRTAVMGILNVTPDSFFDGGRHDLPARAVERAERLVAEGADVIDVGGESTRPGSRPISAVEEIARVVPVIEQLARRLSTPISIDTSKAEVARRALDAGAEIVNDVSALEDPEMAAVVARSGAALVLMHMRGTPATMKAEAVYGDVVNEVRAELEVRVGRARDAGVALDRILLDPGIGFAKTPAHNWELLRRLESLRIHDLPILVGPSRKSFLGQLLGGAHPDDCLEATCASVVASVLHGADLVRVHDPAAVRPHLAVADRLRHGDGEAAS